VIVDGNTLFDMRENLFTFSPEERARIIAHRVIWLSKQPLNRVRDLSISEGGNNSEIFSQDRIIMTVADADAEAAGRSRKDLAREYANKISVAAEALQNKYGLKTIVFGILYTLIATCLLLLVFKLFASAFPGLYRKVESWRGVHILKPDHNTSD